MPLILNYSAYIKALDDEVGKNPKEVWISSFNLNTGVSGTGKVWTMSETYRLLTRVNALKAHSRLMIGVPAQGTDSLIRKVTQNAEHWRNIEWRYRRDHHLKCWIFFFKRKITALVGGRNLGDSGWTDISLFLSQPDATKLVEFYEMLWKTSVPPVTESFSILKDGKRLI